MGSGTKEYFEFFNTRANVGSNAIKASLLINGISAISILTFIGKMSEKHPDKIPLFASSLLFFTLGVLSTGVSSGFLYFVHYQIHFLLSLQLFS